MATALKFTSRELRLIREMERRLIGVRTFADIYKAIEEVMLLVCKAEHLAVGFSHVDNSFGLEWEAPTVKSFLQGYSPWALRCFVYQYTLEHPNTAAREHQMLQGGSLDSTETYERSRMAGLKLRHVLATLLFETRQKFQGGLAMYKDSGPAFTLRDEQLLQAFIPLINEAVASVQYISTREFQGDLLRSLSMEPTAGMVLNAAGRRIEETGSARALLRKWFKPNELSHDVPARWVDYVKVLSSMDCVLPPDQRTLKEERGPEMLEVRFKPSTVLRPGCTLWQVQILEHVHWMRADWYSLLTRRELEVAEMLNRGAANKDIARDLNLSLYTVKDHVTAIFEKTVHGRLAFVTQSRRS